MTNRGELEIMPDPTGRIPPISTQQTLTMWGVYDHTIRELLADGGLTADGLVVTRAKLCSGQWANMPAPAELLRQALLEDVSTAYAAACGMPLEYFYGTGEIPAPVPDDLSEISPKPSNRTS
jgi:hypothetical protein